MLEMGAAIAANAAPIGMQPWRVVEGQHVVVTNRLVDSRAEQALLEDILEEHKPLVPASAAALHWLLFTPFRYPPRPAGSRFRGPGEPGVWYGADHLQTACAELGYWRWRFLVASPRLDMLNAQPQTAFQADIAANGIDLLSPPFVVDRTTFTHPNDYGGCQSLARQARRAGVALIRYESVRDPEHRPCGALLHWKGFARAAPSNAQTWMLEVGRDRVSWRGTNPIDPMQWDFYATHWVYPR